MAIQSRFTLRSRSEMSGLTLVELMLALVISALVMGASVSIYGSLDRMRLKTDQRMQESIKVSQALDQLTLHLRNMYRKGTIYPRKMQRNPLWRSDIVIENDMNGDYPSDRLRLNIVRLGDVRQGASESDVRRAEFGIWSPSSYAMGISDMDMDYELMASKLPLLVMREDPMPRNEEEVRGGVVTALAENVVGLNIVCLVEGEWLEEIEPGQLRGRLPQALLLEVWLYSPLSEKQKQRGVKPQIRREARLVTYGRLPGRVDPPRPMERGT